MLESCAQDFHLITLPKERREGGRTNALPDPDDADGDVGGGGGVSASSLTTRGMDPRMLYGVVVIILAVVVVAANGTVLLFVDSFWLCCITIRL